MSVENKVPSSKKCPYCGGSGVLIGRKKIRIECSACKASTGSYDTISAALNAWNRRYSA